MVVVREERRPLSVHRLRIRLEHRRWLATVGGDAKHVRPNGGENDLAPLVPGTAPGCRGQFAQCLRRSTLNGHLFQTVRCKEPKEPAVWRPEWKGRALS